MTSPQWPGFPSTPPTTPPTMAPPWPPPTTPPGYQPTADETDQVPESRRSGGRAGRRRWAMIAGGACVVAGAALGGGVIGANLADDGGDAATIVRLPSPSAGADGGLDVAAIAARAESSVVMITAHGVADPNTSGTIEPDTSEPDTSEPDTSEPQTTEPDRTEPGDEEESSSVGTGIVYTADGLVVTNAHVVEDADSIFVRLHGEVDSRTARVVGTDPANDLAVLRLENPPPLTPAVFAPTSLVAVGDDVVAIGFALDLDGDPSITRGVVSALRRTLELGDDTLDGLIQTDTAISSGNSGGPLLNANGEVVGINTAVARGDFATAANNIGYAISTDEAMPVIERLRTGVGSDGEPIPQGFLGVMVAPRDDGSVGAIIEDVTEGSPAEKVGLRKGDVVIEADGEQINGPGGLRAVVRDHGPGDTITVVVVRSDETEATFKVTLAPRD